MSTEANPALLVQELQPYAPPSQDDSWGIAEDAWESERDTWRSWEDTELYHDWHQQVVKGRNDFIIAITPSSRTPVSGTGKTTAGVSFAKNFDRSDGGFDAEEKGTLDAGELAYKIIPNVETGSAVVFDEAQGAPGTDSVNSRRGMTTESIDAINAILANRDKNLSLIIIAQQLSMMDKNLYPMIDAWCLIRKAPIQHGGPLMTYHSIYVNDYDLGNPQPKTPGHEDLSWPEIPSSDEDYAVMERKKQAAKQKRSEDASEGEGMGVPDGLADMPQKHRDAVINHLRSIGVERDKVAEAAEVSPSRISQITTSDD
jgi:hypothetical protein